MQRSIDCWAVCRTRNSRGMQLSPHCIVPRVSSCVFYLNLHGRQMALCQTVGRCHVCQTVSGRRRLPDTVLQTPTARHHVCQTVWQWAVWQTASGRHSVWHCQMPSARWPYARLSGRHRVWQTASGRRCLADTLSSRRRLPDTVLETLSAGRRDGRRRLPDSVCQTPSPRRSGRGPSGRRSLADSIWQTVSGRHSV